MAKQDVTRFDMPYGASAPALRSAELGIDRVLARSDASSYSMEVTLLDVADHRLLRAGVVVAQRRSEGSEDWYLAAPAWRPHLPRELVMPFGHGGLPAEMARMVRPFRRTGALTPVATARMCRVEYVVRGSDELLATLRDDRIEIQRGGLTTSRYREVTLTPTKALTSDQRAWLEEALHDVGAARVKKFPTLIARLGAPATGICDLAKPGRWTATSTLADIVAGVISEHLHTIVEADLALLGSDTPVSTADIRAALVRLRRDVEGFYPVLEPSWCQGLLGDIDAALDVSADAPVDLQLGENYLTVLDRLVATVRGPRLGAAATRDAAEVLSQELDAAIRALQGHIAKLAVDAPDTAWQSAVGSAERVSRIARTCRHLWGRKAVTLGKRAKRVHRDLLDCAEGPIIPVQEIAALTPFEAFERGREWERGNLVQHARRADFLDNWPKRARHLQVPRA